MVPMRVLAISFVMVWSTAAAGAEIETLNVAKRGGFVVAEARFVIDAPLATVLDAFTAFDRLAELNPAVVRSKSQMMPNGQTRVSTQVRDCVALFCRTFALVEDVQFDSDNGVFAEIVPELSDFHRGQTRWQFYDLGDTTRVQYLSKITPNFWLPPLLGKRAIHRTLIRQIRATAQNLETVQPSKF